MLDDLIPIGYSDSMFIDKKGDIYSRNVKDEGLSLIANIFDNNSQFVHHYYKSLKRAYEQFNLKVIPYKKIKGR